MKIFIINPDFGVTPEQMAARCRLLCAYVGPDVELHMECLVNNHIEIDSAVDAALAAPEILQMALRAERDGYTALATLQWLPVVSCLVYQSLEQGRRPALWLLWLHVRQACFWRM